MSFKMKQLKVLTTKFNKQDISEILEDAASWIVVLAMYIYGAAKLFQFKGATATGKIVNEMSGLELMWAFYGYSKTFAIILGILEITGATLILFRKTRVIGCIFTSTILINIILQDYFYEVPALRTAILYQSILLIILWMNRERLIETIKVLTRQSDKNRKKLNFFVKLIITFFVFVVFRIAELYITTS